MAYRMRKRSTAITLVLAGSIGSLSGCGEPIPQQDAYSSLNDCVRDWGNATQCQPVRDNRYASSYYYGPAYFGNRYSDGRPKPSPNAMDVVDRTKGTQVSSLTSRSGSSSSFFSRSSSSTSSSSGSSTTSRSGFGSSASSSSS